MLVELVSRAPMSSKSSWEFSMTWLRFMSSSTIRAVSVVAADAALAKTMADASNPVINARIN